MSDPQIVYGIEEKDGEIENLVLTQPDATIKEKVAYDGACKNIGDGHNYAVYDKKGIRHSLKVNEKGELVTDDDKKIKTFFDKELDREEIRKMELGEDSDLTFSKTAMKKGDEQEKAEKAATRGSNASSNASKAKGKNK